MTMTIEAPTYLQVDTKSRGYAYFGLAPPPGVNAYGGSTPAMYNVKIRNGRTTSSAGDQQPELTLDETSFELVECPTALSTEDFYKIQQGNDPDLTQKYHEEVSDFVKSKLGCDKIVCFHSQVRNAKKESAGEGIQGYAIGGPHTDSSALSGDELALHTLEKEQEDPASYKRYLYLNLWRNISEHPIEDYPLAVMDERSAIKPDDYLPRDLFMGNNQHIVQYGLNVRHAAHHKWYYFPQMTKSEAILFKQIDSDWTRPSRTCFHMAVKDPNASADAKPRESIELRMICFWKEAKVDSMPNKSSTTTRTTTATISDGSSTSLGLHSASTIQLLGALLVRLPLIGPLFRHVLGHPLVNMITMILQSSSKEYPPYSGNPEEYVTKVVMAVSFFPQWPSFARWSVQQKLKGCKTLQDASRELATMIVDDSTGQQQMKKFAPQDKKAIVEACLTNDQYLKAVEEHFGKLFVKDDDDADNDLKKEK